MRDDRIGPTPERVAKGDIRINTDPETGMFLSAQVTDTTVLAFLTGKGILDELHGYYANVFLDLRRYFLRRVAYRGNSVYALEFFGSSNSGVLETLYLRVCRGIGKQHEAVIRFATDAQSSNVRMLTIHREVYQTAFDALIRSIDEARKDLKDD